MGSAAASKRQAPSREIPSFFKHHFSESAWTFSIVVVSDEDEIRAAMAEILWGCSLKPVLANGLVELKSVCSKAAPIACLCGFDLAEGTFQEVVDYCEEQPFPIPVIMISPPSVRETPSRFLDSLRAGAIATICYPYRLSDVQIMLWSAIQYQHLFLQSKVRTQEKTSRTSYYSAPLTPPERE